MAIRLKDIALEAGVDIGTVSHVLNRRPKAQLLRQETRDRIMRVASDLGYCRNELAASVSKRRGKILAFICSDMGSIEYTGRVQNGVFNAATELDYAVTIYHLSAGNEEKIIQKLIGWRIAGVIFHVAGLQQAPKLLEALKEHDIPYGVVNLSNPGGIGVTTDDYQGMFAAVRHLKESGSEKPSLFTYRRNKNNFKNGSEYLTCREQGFRAAIEEYYPDLTPVVIYYDEAGPEPENRKLLQKCLGAVKSENLDGVICTSDVLALKLLQICPFCQLRVPEDFLLIGFGNLGMASITIPTITTIAQDFEEMGGRTTQLVIGAVEKKIHAADSCNVLLPVKLVRRESSQSKEKGCNHEQRKEVSKEPNCPVYLD